MFCGCAIGQLGDPPNSNVCEVCLGLPGVLPVVNKAAVEAVLKTALALGCEIPRHTKFDRKNYMYPDLPKGYQISQYDLPISINGRLELDGRQVRIRRVHLEEDTGKLIHAGDKLHKAWESFVDLNRAGVPLMEIVTEPDIRSADEARDYAQALRTLLRTIGASEAEMEKGQLRAEPNISIRRYGSDDLGVKTELKNINSFRALHRELADLFEATARASGEAKQTANWVIGEVAPSGRYPSPIHLAEVVTLVSSGRITRDQGREVLSETINGGGSPAEIVANRGFAQISDESELRTIVEAVIAGNPRAVEDYRAGKKQAMQALMADVRKRAPQANPKAASSILIELLK
jgi:aspartyl-tRNA(Asn)/glutamyl-tRNA(Gln) amidotransferase subunit B